MSDPSPWRRNLTAEQMEAHLDYISRQRALTHEESLRLEWAIHEQKTGEWRASREATLHLTRIEELELSDKIEREMVRSSSSPRGLQLPEI